MSPIQCTFQYKIASILTGAETEKSYILRTRKYYTFHNDLTFILIYALPVISRDARYESRMYLQIKCLHHIASLQIGERIFSAANFHKFIILISRYLLSNLANISNYLWMDRPSAKLSECKIATNFYSWFFDIFCGRHFDIVSGGFKSCNPHFSLLSFSSLRFTHKLETVYYGMFGMVLVS